MIYYAKEKKTWNLLFKRNFKSTRVPPAVHFQITHIRFFIFSVSYANANVVYIVLKARKYIKNLATCFEIAFLFRLVMVSIQIGIFLNSYKSFCFSEFVLHNWGKVKILILIGFRWKVFDPGLIFYRFRWIRSCKIRWKRT